MQTRQLVNSYDVHSFLDLPKFARQGEGSHKINETHSVTLICGHNLESNPTATITWIDPNGKEISTTDTENYIQNDGPDVVQLHIKQANRKDRGNWTCNMKIPDSNICIHDCSDGEKWLSRDQNGWQSQEEYCLSEHKSLTNMYTVNLDVLCK